MEGKTRSQVPSSGKANAQLTVDQINADRITQVQVDSLCTAFDTLTCPLIFAGCFKVLGTTDQWRSLGL